MAWCHADTCLLPLAHREGLPRPPQPSEQDRQALGACSTVATRPGSGRREPWLFGFDDLDAATLIDVVTGRTSASVTGWLAQLSPAERAAITVVVTDPHAGYRAALSNLAGVTAVVDRFHVAVLAGR
ncbi:MAG: transposase [Acidimicrobiia bacterium]|jgi:hypothetical protein|nr:transposase [Acidimicrobiia bacterium]